MQMFERLNLCINFCVCFSTKSDSNLIFTNFKKMLFSFSLQDFFFIEFWFFFVDFLLLTFCLHLRFSFPLLENLSYYTMKHLSGSQYFWRCYFVPKKIKK